MKHRKPSARARAAAGAVAGVAAAAVAARVSPSRRRPKRALAAARLSAMTGSPGLAVAVVPPAVGRGARLRAQSQRGRIG